MNWYQEYRMDWILETLRVYGYLNRQHLVRKFGISRAQASADLKTFMRIYPSAMTYDTSGKSYVAK